MTTVIAALTLGFHLLGRTQGFSVEWSDPIGWLNTVSPDQAIAGLLRSVGIASGYWITASTALYALIAQRSAPVPRLVRIITMPGIRRMVDRALATALAASIAATPFTPAIAAESPPPPVVFDINADGVPVPHIRPPLQTSVPDTQSADEMPTADDDRPVSASPTRVAPIPPVVGTFVHPVAPAALVSQSTETTHTVDGGDNLWVIADQHLRAAGFEPTNAVITSYWRRVIEANRPTLRSGDPNLIYPGEIINLPPVEMTR